MYVLPRPAMVSFLPTPLHSFISLVYFLHHLCYNFCSVTISVITTCFVQRTPPFLPHPFVYVCIILINMDISAIYSNICTVLEG